jgi:predicted transcriptional regulator
MRTLVFGVMLATALALVPLAAATAVHVDATVSAGGSSVTAPSPAVAAPDAPHLPASGPAAPSANDILQLASVHTNAADGGIGVDAGAHASDGATGDASPGEKLVATVLPAVEKAAPPTLATVGVLALLNALGVWRFAGVGAIGLYSRLTKSELLDNQHRDRVYKLIQEEPGLGVSEIAERTGLGWGTTVYHLDRLERAGFVAPERAGLHKAFFPVGTVAREARKAMGALKADTTRSIAEFLVTRPGATQTELCEALSLSPSAASKQVSKLESAGLVRRERDWKTVHLHPTDALPAMLGGDAPTPAPVTLTPSVPPLAA